MSAIRLPDTTLLQDWLDDAAVEYYICGQCDGLHLRMLQGTQGVIDSRLFLEDYGLLLTTELELRPAAVLQVSADLGRLNMDYPTLKVFLDVVDEALPQLVMAAVCHCAAGISREQFAQFLGTSLEESGRLAASCQQLDYIYSGAEPGGAMLH